jgi:hypothetical protein
MCTSIFNHGSRLLEIGCLVENIFDHGILGSNNRLESIHADIFWL